LPVRDRGSLNAHRGAYRGECGKGAEAITDSSGANAWPAFSPDGRYIAYIHYDARPEKTGEQGTLMVFDVEALTNTRVAPAGMRCHSRLSWKP
ncbi:MAG TPA: hypothetical protein VGX78_22710, partial [Pirellulales bacterium]|nr:hypothetical protein [Pirellulales bacterium]